MRWATGRYANFQCQRCSFVYPYLEMRKEWTGLRVCESCWDAKHPQLDPPRVYGDAIALKDATGYDTEKPGAVGAAIDAIISG